MLHSREKTSPPPALLHALPLSSVGAQRHGAMSNVLRRLLPTPNSEASSAKVPLRHTTRPQPEHHLAQGLGGVMAELAAAPKLACTACVILAPYCISHRREQPIVTHLELFCRLPWAAAPCFVDGDACNLCKTALALQQGRRVALLEVARPARGPSCAPQHFMTVVQRPLATTFCNCPLS